MFFSGLDGFETFSVLGSLFPWSFCHQSPKDSAVVRSNHRKAYHSIKLIDRSGDRIQDDGDGRIHVLLALAKNELSYSALNLRRTSSFCFQCIHTAALPSVFRKSICLVACIAPHYTPEDQEMVLHFSIQTRLPRTTMTCSHGISIFEGSDFPCCFRILIY